MSSLLEEAIVDAKALKEAALKNAENAVLEKYSQEVKGALSTLLEQEDALTLGTEAETPQPSDTSFLKEIPYAFQNEAIEAPAEEELVEIDFDALKTRIAEEEAQGIEAAPDEMLDAADLALDLSEADDPVTPVSDEDEASLADPDGPDVGITADHPLSDEEIEQAAVEEGVDEEVNLSEELIASLIEELVVDIEPVPQGWSSVSSAYNGVEQANNDAMAAAANAHLEEDEELEEEESTAPDVTHMVYETKITKLTDSNKELRALLKEAKLHLTRLNLDNAKLVYQNKALNSASLNERQKIQIAEAVQSANSVEEASMIYETIQNAVGASTDPRTRPQTLREAVQRPTSLLINSKRNNTATRDPNMDRMLRLAGLTKQ
jgi:hypothetical protein